MKMDIDMATNFQVATNFEHLVNLNPNLEVLSLVCMYLFSWKWSII
jgi:hypothetical protein